MKKAELALNYFVISTHHEMFAFRDLAPGERLEDVLVCIQAPIMNWISWRLKKHAAYKSNLSAEVKKLGV